MDAGITPRATHARTHAHTVSHGSIEIVDTGDREMRTGARIVSTSRLRPTTERTLRLWKAHRSLIHSVAGRERSVAMSLSSVCLCVCEDDGRRQ